MSLDGRIVYRGPVPPAPLKVNFPLPSPPQLVKAEAVFPDGQRAVFTNLLHADHPESAEVSLHSVPILVSAEAVGEEPAAQLRRAGWNVRTVEKGDPDIVFVVEPQAFQAAAPLVREARLRGARSNDVFKHAASVQIIVADEALTRLDAFSGTRDRSGWLDVLFTASLYAGKLRRRTADAVAAAGYLLGATPRPRVVVLIASDREPDGSGFSPEQARRYLSETLVPLVVWKVGSAGASTEWPEDRRMRVDHDLYDSLIQLAHDVSKQGVAWLEGGADVREIQAPMPSGITLAGRIAAQDSAAAEAPRAVSGSGKPGRSVFAVVTDLAAPARVYAGTEAGLFESEDTGTAWKPITGADAIAVYSLAFARDRNGFDLVTGTSGNGARRFPEGGWTAFPTSEVLAVLADPFDFATLYAGVRRGVLKSTDGGAHWEVSSKDLPRTFALALAADPRRRGTIYAAIAGDGVYRSTNGAASWSLRGDELRKTVVRSLAIDPGDSDRICVGTDGGLFTSANAGSHWSAAPGVPRSPVYVIAFDPARPGTIWAGSANGLFVSPDGGKTWRPVRDYPMTVTALAFDRQRNGLFVGTLTQGLHRLALNAAGQPAE